MRFSVVVLVILALVLGSGIPAAAQTVFDPMQAGTGVSFLVLEGDIFFMEISPAPENLTVKVSPAGEWILFNRADATFFAVLINQSENHAITVNFIQESPFNYVYGVYSVNPTFYTYTRRERSTMFGDSWRVEIERVEGYQPNDISFFFELDVYPKPQRENPWEGLLSLFEGYKWIPFLILSGLSVYVSSFFGVSAYYQFKMEGTVKKRIYAGIIIPILFIVYIVFYFAT